MSMFSGQYILRYYEQSCILSFAMSLQSYACLCIAIGVLVRIATVAEASRVGDRPNCIVHRLSMV